MMTMEHLNGVLDKRPVLSKDNLVEPVSDLYQRVHLLERIHYIWAPIAIGTLVLGYFAFRKRA